jgi:hypothetical protein
VNDISCWESSTQDYLFQGEYIENCPVIVVPECFNATEIEATVELRNLLIMTQSCDLAQSKAKFVAVCPVYTLEVYAEANELYTNRKQWEQVRQGKVEGLHMIGGFTNFENENALVVDFRQIYSLPLPFLTQFCKNSKRIKLKSPYLEHMAQAFARFFMRVGLPSAIKPFK